MSQNTVDVTFEATLQEVWWILFSRPRCPKFLLPPASLDTPIRTGCSSFSFIRILTSAKEHLRFGEHFILLIYLWFCCSLVSFNLSLHSLQFKDSITVVIWLFQPVLTILTLLALYTNCYDYTQQYYYYKHYHQYSHC